jgi:hypothetical protein
VLQARLRSWTPSQDAFLAGASIGLAAPLVSLCGSVLPLAGSSTGVGIEVWLPDNLPASLAGPDGLTTAVVCQSPPMNGPPASTAGLTILSDIVTVALAPLPAHGHDPGPGFTCSRSGAGLQMQLQAQAEGLYNSLGCMHVI